ncbi:FAD-binding oxidoreductase [Cardinium endosymbiont of Tipula unca]|uniref:FAD-binding oxidoreductase n=1 Tax=Cardinium endosymbiont of Tipula unca TaxID=3066216 RepID=UPI0030CB7F4C
MITPSVLHLTFARVDNLPLVFKAGQFITFLLLHESGRTIRRSYSLANCPEQSYELEIAVAPVYEGFATKILFNLKYGDELLCVGPQGRLIIKNEEAAHHVLVATGTGLAPYRSMLSTIARRIENHQFFKATVLLGVRYVVDLLYVDEFLEYAQKYERFNFHAYLSREKTLAQPYQHPGYVQSAFDTLDLNPDVDLVYLCGNPYMIDESMDQLQKMGFGSHSIRREKYTSLRVVS